MTRDEAQDSWEKIVEIGFASYEKLTREQRVWFNVEPLTTGGLWDHYSNYGADRNTDTIADLEYLNFNSVANQLREFNKTYLPNGVHLKDQTHDRRNLTSMMKTNLKITLRKWTRNFGKYLMIWRMLY